MLGRLGHGGPQHPAGRKLAEHPKTAAPKPPVWFSHLSPPKPGIVCEVCHHDYQEGRNLWREGQPVEKCQDCHDLTPKAGVLDAREAFHRRCKGCHLTKRKVRQPAGPIKCEGCHRPQRRGGG